MKIWLTLIVLLSTNACTSPNKPKVSKKDSATAAHASQGHQQKNRIKNCTLVVTTKGIEERHLIPARNPGASLVDGAVCTDSIMNLYKKISAPDGTKLKIYLYADRDRNKKTHFVYKVSEKKVKESAKPDLITDKSPCDLIDKKHGGFRGVYTTSKGTKLKIHASCSI